MNTRLTWRRHNLGQKTKKGSGGTLELGRHFLFLGIIAWEFTLAGFDIKINNPDDKTLQSFCQKTKPNSNESCSKKYLDENYQSENYKVLEISKDGSDMGMILSLGVSEKQGLLPPVVVNFTKINHQLSFCRFGLKISAKNYTSEVESLFVDELSSGVPIKILVQTGAMCELVSKI